MSSDKHYNKKFDGRIDVYRICRLYDITDPAIYHAIKKLLRAGNSFKSKKDDVEGAILSMERWLEMEENDEEINYIDEEEQRDYLYQELDNMEKENAQFLMKDVCGREYWDINAFCNQMNIDLIIEARSKVNEYSMGQEEYMAQMLCNSSPKVLQPIVNAVDKSSSLSMIPNFVERTVKTTKEWISNLSDPQKEELRLIIKNKREMYM